MPDAAPSEEQTVAKADPTNSPQRFRSDTWNHVGEFEGRDAFGEYDRLRSAMWSPDLVSTAYRAESDVHTNRFLKEGRTPLTESMHLAASYPNPSQLQRRSGPVTRMSTGYQRSHVRAVNDCGGKHPAHEGWHVRQAPSPHHAESAPQRGYFEEGTQRRNDLGRHDSFLARDSYLAEPRSRAGRLAPDPNRLVPRETLRQTMYDNSWRAPGAGDRDYHGSQAWKNSILMSQEHKY